MRCTPGCSRMSGPRACGGFLTSSSSRTRRLCLGRVSRCGRRAGARGGLQAGARPSSAVVMVRVHSPIAPPRSPGAALLHGRGSTVWFGSPAVQFCRSKVQSYAAERCLPRGLHRWSASRRRASTGCWASLSRRCRPGGGAPTARCGLRLCRLTQQKEEEHAGQYVGQGRKTAAEH